MTEFWIFLWGASCTKSSNWSRQNKCVHRCNTAQKMKFFTKDFFSKCEQICSFLRIWLNLLKKSLMENFIFCTHANAIIPSFAKYAHSYYYNTCNANEHCNAKGYNNSSNVDFFIVTLYCCNWCFVSTTRNRCYCCCCWRMNWNWTKILKLLNSYKTSDVDFLTLFFPILHKICENMIFRWTYSVV